MAIKAYFSNQIGAPTLNGTVGSLIAVLDACLVNGYNQVNVSSITRSGSTVTVTCATAHGYENPVTTYYVQNGVGNVCTIAGAAQAEYNGDWPISYVSDTVFTFDIGTATPTTPATGTITTKRAGGGWSKVFSDTNRGAYRSNDLSSRRHFWQVNDIADCPNGQGARYAGCRGFENMRGIDDWDYPFPTIVAAGVFGQYICKSNALDSSSRHWSLYTDGKTVIMTIHPDQGGGSVGTVPGTSSFSYTLGFGDLLSPVPDPYATFCGASSSSDTTFSATTNSGLTIAAGTTDPSPNSSNGWNAIARRHSGAAIPVWSAAILGNGWYNQMSLGYNGGMMFPDQLSNRFMLTQCQMYETSSSGAVLRGYLPFYENGCGVVHSNREIIGNVVQREGRKFQYIRTGAKNATYVGGVYIDLTGNSQGKWS